MNNYQIRFFANSWSDRVRKVIAVVPGRLLTFTDLLQETSCPFTYLFIESPLITTSFFAVELFADCPLIKLQLSSLSLCTVVLSFYLEEVVYILVLSLVLLVVHLLGLHLLQGL